MKAQSAYFSLSNDTGYDALEVHTVEIFLDDYADLLSAGEEVLEGGSIIWCLYGHTPNEGLECIGDFNSFDSACEVAEKLGGNKF